MKVAAFSASGNSLSTTLQPRFRWRRLVQYRLRSLLILATIASGSFAWWSYTARRQHDAVIALTNAGAAIVYDIDDHNFSPPRFRWPGWLVDRLGKDYFARPTRVYFPNGGRDRDMESVGKLTALQYLSCGDELLAKLPAGGLIASQQRLTDAGLVHLSHLSELQMLDLSCTGVTDAGLAHLRGLNKLADLNLDSTRVTGPGLAKLSNLPELQKISLQESLITDDGLMNLQGLKSLTMLDLQSTQVSDAGMKHLHQMKNLEWLDLRNTGVTNGGLSPLYESLPKCSIKR